MSPADDVGSPVEAAGPHVVADHRHRVCVPAGILARIESSPQDRANTQRFKVVGGDYAAGCPLGSFAGAQRRAADVLGDEALDQRGLSS